MDPKIILLYYYYRNFFITADQNDLFYNYSHQEKH